MQIAAAQTIVSPSVAANGALIRQVISQAASEGARLVHFCEGALSGYSKFQISDPQDWTTFDWKGQERELRAIAALCGQLRVFAVIGGAHRLDTTHLPHNSLYIISDEGVLLTRYDKRYLSNSEVSAWYTPGTSPIVFAVDGYQFGCAICIESQFYEVFLEYEQMGVDAVLFSSYGIPGRFQIALRAHAGLNCIWISAATPFQRAEQGPAGIIGPDGKWASQCNEQSTSGYVSAMLDRDDPAYDVPLRLARPWRNRVRCGEIYEGKQVEEARSTDRSRF